MVIMVTKNHSVDVDRNRITGAILQYVRGDCRYTKHDVMFTPTYCLYAHILQMWDMFVLQWPRK